MAGRGRPGPTGLGPRKLLAVKLHPELKESLAQQAILESRSVTSLVTQLIADYLQLPHLTTEQLARRAGEPHETAVAPVREHRDHDARLNFSNHGFLPRQGEDSERTPSSCSVRLPR